jgi:hypothetical protein
MVSIATSSSSGFSIIVARFKIGDSVAAALEPQPATGASGAAAARRPR